MDAILVELGIIFLLVIANGILAMTEMAVVSARKSRLQEWADDGDQSAKLALEIVNAPTEFLSTVQFGITLVGIIAGTFGGATIAKELAIYLADVPFFAPYAHATAIAIVVTVITYLSLVIGELVPKRIALYSPELISKHLAVPIKILSKLVKPIVTLLSWSTNFVLGTVRLERHAQPVITEGEIEILVDQATKAGIFKETEDKMLKRVFTLGNRKVASLMTPRKDVVWLDANASQEEILKFVSTCQHTRIPVAKGSIDQVLGIFETKEIVRQFAQGKAIDLQSVMLEPVYVPETTTPLELLERFRDAKQRVALVLDEYGALLGLVSRDDVFKAIAGSLFVFGELPKWKANKQADGSWIIDGQIPLEEFNKIFGKDKLPTDEMGSYHTLAGFILNKLGHLPKENESFDYEGLHFKITAMDLHRINKVLVSKTAHSKDQGQS
jgi:putative hemolysin